MQKDEIKKVAKLAAIKIEDKDIEPLNDDVNKILAMVNQMQEVDTSGVLPMSHPQDAVQKLRVDEAISSNVRDEVQKLAPMIKDGLYLVPKVIE